MNSTMTMTVELTSDDIKMAIAEYVARNFMTEGFEVAPKNVTLLAGMEYADHPMDRGSPACTGARAVVTQKHPTTVTSWRSQ